MVPVPGVADEDGRRPSREQGISKDANRRLRTAMVELAWLWLRWQPDSALFPMVAGQNARGRKCACAKGS